MRLNTPVTNTEYPFPSGATLVSTTDAKGRILYCNPRFIEVSGYEHEELLGQPHNIIRHPEMPEEAFRDMWETIESGRPWSGPVKNRRKNGDFYWVRANVTPLYKGEEIVGYMSVRTELSRQEIAGADELFAGMRQEREQDRLETVFRGGRVMKNTLGGRLSEALRLGISSRMFLAILVLLLGSHLLFRFVPADTTASLAGVWAVQVLLALGVWRFLLGQVFPPIRRLVFDANRMASGDLSQTVQRTRYDEFGELEVALGQLGVNLKSIVREARDQSLQMLAGMKEVAKDNLDLANRTDSQAANLQETAASMEEITGTVKHTSDSAGQASTLTGQVVVTAERSSEAVNEVDETMTLIRDTSGRINEITQVIDSIAFQTNILALNAAVEAARAGHQGKGFAVVASEVRALAQRTSIAAKEINTLIEESTRRIASGHQKTRAARETMGEVVEGIRQVNLLVDEIHHATREQLTGISQINAAMTQLEGITQSNAVLAERMAAAAKSMEGLAGNTSETVQVFRLEGERSNTDAVALRKAMKKRQQHALTAPSAGGAAR